MAHQNQLKNSTVQSEDSKQKLSITATQSVYSGPLPPAVEFEKYNQILPGSADRILRMAEKQGSHRRFLENVVVLTESLSSIVGSIFAFLVILATIVAGTYLIAIDKTITGLTSMFGPLVIIAGLFIHDRRKSKKE